MTTLKLAAVAVQLIAFCSYVLYTRIKFGPTFSISSTFYSLEGKGKILFSWFTWLVSLPLLVFAFDEGVNYWFLSATALISFVGVFTLYRTKSVEWVHIACATGGIILAFIGLHSWIPVAIMLVLGATTYLSRAMTRTWWIEVIAFVIIIITLSLTIYTP